MSEETQQNYLESSPNGGSSNFSGVVDVKVCDLKFCNNNTNANKVLYRGVVPKIGERDTWQLTLFKTPRWQMRLDIDPPESLKLQNLQWKHIPD